MPGADNGLFDMVGPCVPDFEQVLTGSEDSTFGVGEAAKRVLPGQLKTLRFCFLNIRKATPDAGTLPHEMDVRSVFAEPTSVLRIGFQPTMQTQ